MKTGISHLINKVRGHGAIMLILTIKIKGKSNFVTGKDESGQVEVSEKKTFITQVVKIQDSAWKYWATPGAAGIILSKKREWKVLSQKKRIEAVLETIAGSNSFVYEIVTD